MVRTCFATGRAKFIRLDVFKQGCSFFDRSHKQLFLFDSSCFFLTAAVSFLTSLKSSCSFFDKSHNQSFFILTGRTSSCSCPTTWRRRSGVTSGCLTRGCRRRRATSGATPTRRRRRSGSRCSNRSASATSRPTQVRPSLLVQFAVLRIRDLVPFLTPGSGMGKKIRIRIRDPDPGWTARMIFARAQKQFFEL